MKQRDSIEVESFILLKVARAAIRMKHSIAAEREINATLPALEAEFWRQVQQGELPNEVTARAALTAVLGDE